MAVAIFGSIASLELKERRKKEGRVVPYLSNARTRSGQVLIRYASKQAFIPPNDHSLDGSMGLMIYLYYLQTTYLPTPYLYDVPRIGKGRQAAQQLLARSTTALCVCALADRWVGCFAYIPTYKCNYLHIVIGLPH